MGSCKSFRSGKVLQEPLVLGMQAVVEEVDLAAQEGLVAREEMVVERVEGDGIVGVMMRCPIKVLRSPSSLIISSKNKCLALRLKKGEGHMCGKEGGISIYNLTWLCHLICIGSYNISSFCMSFMYLINRYPS